MCVVPPFFTHTVFVGRETDKNIKIGWIGQLSGWIINDWMCIVHSLLAVLDFFPIPNITIIFNDFFLVVMVVECCW
jgi:hypothetical protein